MRAPVPTHSHTRIQDRLISLLPGRAWDERSGVGDERSDERTVGLLALWPCSTEPTRARLDSSMGAYLEMLLQEPQQGTLRLATGGDGEEGENGLSRVLELVQFLQECPPACQRVMIDFLQTWDGVQHRSFILDMLPYLRRMSWQQLSEGVLQRLVPVFASCAPLVKARFLRALAALICRWIRHAPSSLHSRSDACVSEGGDHAGSAAWGGGAGSRADMRSEMDTRGETTQSREGHDVEQVVIGRFFREAAPDEGGLHVRAERAEGHANGGAGAGAGAGDGLAHGARCGEMAWSEQLQRLLLFFDRLAVLGASPLPAPACRLWCRGSVSLCAA